MRAEQPSVPRSSSMVLRDTESTDAQALLASAVCALEERLGPILRCVPESPSQAEKQRESQSGVDEMHLSNMRSMSGWAHTIRTIIDRIDL